MSEVSEFLARLGLEALAEQFEAEGIDSVELLASLETSEFGQLGIKIGHRKRIQKALGVGSPSALGSLGSGPAAAWQPISDQETALGRSLPAPGPPPSAMAGTSGPELKVGERLGSFELLQVLGTGGFGRVWKVRDHVTHADRALKVVHTQGPVDLALQTLTQEFAVRARIADTTHVLEAERPRRESHAGRDIVVMPMELADGGNLGSWTLQRRTEPLEGWLEGALDLFAQACAGVEAIHAAGVAHLDLKPENLLLVDGRIKVADFGLSRDLDHLSSIAGALLADGVGTPLYMAPEQVQAARAKNVGPSADVWALGVILYELLDGSPPFSGLPGTIKAKIKDPTVEIGFDSIPSHYRDLLIETLTRNPHRRTPSAVALREGLTRARTPANPPARPPEPKGEPVDARRPQEGKSEERASTRSAEVSEFTHTPSGIRMVRLPDGSYLGKYTVTNALYAAFLTARDGSNQCGEGRCVDDTSEYLQLSRSGDRWTANSGYANHPVVEVTWYGANAFAEYYGLVLPTEAQWQYASEEGDRGRAWAGTDTEADLPTYANLSGSLAPVGSLAPNGWGLHDMSGNVWEWTSTPSGVNRVLRGGSFRFTPGLARCAYRNWISPSVDWYDLGFRVALPPQR